MKKQAARLQKCDAVESFSLLEVQQRLIQNDEELGDTESDG